MGILKTHSIENVCASLLAPVKRLDFEVKIVHIFLTRYRYMMGFVGRLKAPVKLSDLK